MASNSDEDVAKKLHVSHKHKRKKAKSSNTDPKQQHDSMKEQLHDHGDGQRNLKKMKRKQMQELEHKDISGKKKKSKISSRHKIPEHDKQQEKSPRSSKRRKKHQTFLQSEEESESDSGSDTEMSKEIKLQPTQSTVKGKSAEKEKHWDTAKHEDSSELSESLDDDEDSDNMDRTQEDGKDKQKNKRDFEEKSGETSEQKSQDDGEDPESEMAAIRKELSTMPFEELQKLKEKLGLKLYNKTMFGNPSDDKRKKFTRANKNRPMEMSSKVRVKRHRQVVQVKKRVTRDPRFDDLSGQYDETFFGQAYSFLDDVKHKEKEKLVKLHAKEKDEDKRKQLKYLINRLTQQEKTVKEKMLRQDREREIKKKERELVQEGKTPFYLKKSEKRKLELAEKYKELKKSGKLDKYLSKKRKKNAAKDRRKMPTSTVS